MIRAKTASFILESKLNTNKESLYILNKRFEIARIMYNTTLKYANKQLKRMRENKSYKKIFNQYMNSESKEDKKLYGDLLNSIRISYSLTEFQLQEHINFQRQMYKDNIDVNTAQKIASNVWKAVESVLFGKGKQLHFKKFGTLTSLEGKDNKMGIKFRTPETKKYKKTKIKTTNKHGKKITKIKYKLTNKSKTINRLEWIGLNVPIKIRNNDLFIKESLETSRIKYCRIIRKPFKNGYEYFLQLVMEGLPPVKRINSNGNFRHSAIPNNKVGIDIGTSTIAVCSDKKVILTELAPNVKKYEKSINNLYRKLQRSRIATNPDNYNPDGTIKRGVKLKWVRSKSYMKTLFKLKDRYRQKANYIKLSHNKLANEIVSLGNEIYVETMNFKALQKRAKNTTINKKGKMNKKKRFGKSLNNKAPAQLITIIDRKLKYIEKNINKVNTKTFKASQYNHIDDNYKKKKLSQRWNYLNKDKIQRDLYSSFLLMNSKKDLKKTDRDLCLKEYNKFKENHDKCIKELEENNNKLLSSFGIKKKTA